MYFQMELLREGVAMNLNDTYKLELPDWGSLGSILLRFNGAQATGLGQSGGKWRIIDFLSKLEVILNGSTICKSLKADMVQAIAFYDNGILSPDPYRNYATNVQYCYILLNFGRKLYDPLLGLQLDNYKSTELLITNDATTASFSDLAVTVMAVWRREVDTPFTHHLRSEEWRKWTTVADETQYLELPTQFPIRRILLQAIPALDAAFIEKTELHNLMDDIDLAFATGSIRVYKGGIDDIMRLNLYHYGRNLIMGGSTYMFADKGINMGLGRVEYSAHGSGSLDGAASATIPTMQGSNNAATQKPETYEADSPIQLIVGGMAYHHTIVFPFDMGDMPENYLDPDLRKTVKLDIHTRNDSNAASGTNRVILDRLVPNA